MGMTDINNAAAAQNALTARINAFLNDIDADIATRQAAYDALAADLIGVVEDKLDQRIYVDAANGDNSAAGASTSPVATIQEAYGRLVPGCSAEIRLKRGDTYTVSRAAACDLDNAYIYLDVWGDAGAAKPLIVNELTNLNGAGYSNGFTGFHTQIFALNCAFRAALNPDTLRLTGFNGMFTAYRGASYTFQSCDFDLGDVNMVNTPYTDPVTLSLRSCNITRQAGATGKMLLTTAGVFRATSVTIPAGETWADLIAGQVYAADGEARNFITNVQI